MSSSSEPVSRDELALQYVDSLPFAPYEVQERAIFAWFADNDGVLVAAPTGTGKTLIAEAVVFEALKTGRRMYYTTPLIALTEQKFRELQETAQRWGFSPDSVGLVTGNRKVNPDAAILVVVAEILLNRLLQPASFDFENVCGVVMDEFHSFADLERGIVWEFSLSLLPPHVRLLLLSATIGNANQFLSWLRDSTRRQLQLVQSTDRKVPLTFRWVGDKLLNEHLEEMAAGDAETRRTPALVFCFNREECWNVAEELTGKAMLAEGQQKQLLEKVSAYSWTGGAGPKLKRVLLRGVGVHHAGLLPKFRRVVEELFQQKLLSVCVCTETLSAGINLPARSVVMPSLLKGPSGKQKLIDSSTAHQIFGRAGRPQFDEEGFVFALPHEDDVRILRWKERYDQIPENTGDPNLIRAKKNLKKKMPVRSPQRQYWNEQQFDKLRAAPPKDLISQGHFPWRMLAYMLEISPDVQLVRNLLRKRLSTAMTVEAADKHLNQMLLTMHSLGAVVLDPPPPTPNNEPGTPSASKSSSSADATTPAEPPTAMARLIMDALKKQHAATGKGPKPVETPAETAPAAQQYRPERAVPTPRLAEFFAFRSVNPVYALFLLDHLSLADDCERLQIFESVLELPRSLMRSVRVPRPDHFPPGPMATEWLDGLIVSRGILTADDLYPSFDPDIPFEDRKYAPPLGDKLKLLFDSQYSGVHGLSVTAVWAAGRVAEFGYNFENYVSSMDLSRQEGLVFRHLLRLVLLLGEFAAVTPVGVNAVAWRDQLKEWSLRFSECCQRVDPQSTEHTLQHALEADPIVKLAEELLAKSAHPVPEMILPDPVALAAMTNAISATSTSSTQIRPHGDASLGDQTDFASTVSEQHAASGDASGTGPTTTAISSPSDEDDGFGDGILDED